MDNKIKVTNDLGQSFEVEVLDIFSVVGYEGKDYILYTLGEEVNSEQEQVYVSVLEKQGEDKFSLLEISDPKEWEVVQQAIKEESETE